MIRTWRAVCLAVVATLTTASGCVIDLKIRPDGWCKLRMVYPLVAPSTAAIERRRFASPHFRIASVVLRDGQTAVVKAALDDVTRLNTTQIFRNIVVDRKPEDGDVRLTATFTNPMPRETKDQDKPGPRIDVTVPGPVHDANWHAAVTGNHVRWSFSESEFLKQPKLDLSLRYTRPAAR